MRWTWAKTSNPVEAARRWVPPPPPPRDVLERLTTIGLKGACRGGANQG